MTDLRTTHLSPAAHAVVQAAHQADYASRPGIAAALRAAATQLPRSAIYPSSDWGLAWRTGIHDAERKLLAIAAELEVLQ